MGARFEYRVSIRMPSRQNKVRPSVTGYCSFGQVFSQRVPPSGVKQENPSSFASALSMSRAGPRFIFEIFVVSPVVSAPGLAQMQVSDPSDPTPDGPNAASLSGVSPSSARTDSERIARQSVGSAMVFVVAVGLGDGLALASGDEVSDADADAGGLLVEPAPSPDTGPHAVRAATSTSRAATVTGRAFMTTPYSGAHSVGERIAGRHPTVCRRDILSR